MRGSVDGSVRVAGEALERIEYVVEESLLHDAD